MPPWLQTDHTVFARFEHVARVCPGNIAVREGKRTITYEALLERARQAAATIHSGDDSPLGICLPAGLDFIVAILAALRQGRPYIPLSPAHPAALRDDIIRDADAHTIIREGLAPSGNAAPPAPRARPGSVACILYTSGSTGRPKGVYQSQEVLLQDIRQYGEAIALHDRDVMTWLYAPVTGGAIRDIFGALLHGAELVVMDAQALGLRGIQEVLHRTRVTILHLIPPLLREFLAADPSPESLTQVRMLYVAGDRFFRHDLEHIRRVFPAPCRVYTGIGATECTTLYRHWVIPTEYQVTTDLVPVGFDVPGKHTRLIDEQGRDVPAGETGEIEVSSTFIALGYWNQPERTREAFRADPTAPEQRVYRTGDMGRLLPDGNLVFAGRKDGMVKIRGHRVEPTAIEAALRSVPGIHDAAVLVDEDPAPALVAVLVADAGLASQPEAVRTKAVRAALAAQLPEPALPATMLWRDTLPRLLSYKVNQRELLEAVHFAHDPIAALWQRAVTAPDIPGDNLTFAAAGGNSLAAMRLHVELEKTVETLLPAGLIHDHQTLSGLRVELQRFKQTPAPDPQIPVWFVIGGLGWNVPHADEFARDFAALFRLHPVPLRDPGVRGLLDIPSLGTHVAHVVRTWRDQQGPAARIGLLGVSLGALIAHEAACQLQQEHIHLHGLIAIDLGPASPQLDSSIPYRLRKAWRSIRQGERRFTFAWAVGAFLNFVLPARWLAAYTRRLTAQPQSFSPSTYTMMNRLVFRSLSAWTPRVYEDTLTLVKPVDGLGKASPGAPADFGWGLYASRVIIKPVPGGHIESFNAGTREHLAALMRGEEKRGTN